MSALNELRRHFGLDWKKMGKDGMKEHLRTSLANIATEQQKVCDKLGAASIVEMERKLLSGQLKGPDSARYMHEYSRMAQLTRLAKAALEELELPDPDAIEDEFEGVRRY